MGPMANQHWTANQAWEYVANEVLTSSDVLHHWAYAVGLNDIDDFMYLPQADFEFVFNLPTLDDEGKSSITPQCLSRVLTGKLSRAQRWYDKQSSRSYNTRAGLTTEGLNYFRDFEPSPTTNLAIMTSTPTPSTP